MEHIEIKLPKEQLALFNDRDLPQLLGDIFKQGTNNYARLSYEIQREFKAGGSPEVSRMLFDRVKFNEQTARGSFRVVLDINFTFGCEDIKTEKSGQTSEWTFSLDQTTSIITLYSSPFAESRSTADEF